ncbi:CaiB/BaiF CoA transferase family protein [Ruania alba]|uniref:Crotonobetainyl-CoA:carnitine CoA-transferase CaiB n=1 Tax=Ruania alba TaxID=648782 RepID=A0A1H5L309_9MICO|nr:CoA transferase [Ruania alba]SEE71465.1 Crotonobetainyl-CoA:carnitine CoA-transferase CaiB [Ruania alba]
MTASAPIPDPLEGFLVLDFSQFLAGPVAALRLADLGARVIKIERPGLGDIGRGLAFAGAKAGADTVSFHAMNRGKESLAANLKDPGDLAVVRELVDRADVVVENFRPGVMERLGLDYETVRATNPGVVYGSITGYGEEGPWRDRPGQDLLAQSIAGVPWLQADPEPSPMGIAIADHLASCHLAHGITALLLRRLRTGIGGHVRTSLLEAMVDMQFEMLSVRLTDPAALTEPVRGPHSAHSYLPAPYGVYPTADGYLSIAMNPVPRVGELLQIPELVAMTTPQTWWEERSRIEGLIADRLRTDTTAAWLTILDEADIWCAPLHTVDELVEHEGFRRIDMVQTLHRTEPDGTRTEVTTTRSPLRIDGVRPRSASAAPSLGQDSGRLRSELTPAERAS